MKTIENISRMSTFAKMMKKEGKSIGLVPTMGYLHDGHLSLVKAAKKHTDVVVMSIFVNPIQFGPKEDFEEYPRDLKHDEEMAREAGVDVIFHPLLKDIYPEGYATYVTVEKLTSNLCGESRPGHFRGVATVVTKLFNIVKPEVAYFGQKDMQQAMMIKKMALDLNMDIEIKIMPIVREKDGLAMSSRNTYLSGSERRDAAVLYQSLLKAETLIKNGERDAGKVIKAIEDMIKAKESARIEYVKLVDARGLKDIKTITGEIAIAVAVFFSNTRLIDNITIMVK
ncbi:MAG: pantoate--beta-alanine ligase [Candidatus Omnitrophica bacterium]|nr:pantoate--beta-alanine ligase [Candidatus Omnitrophota bacterium]